MRDQHARIEHTDGQIEPRALPGPFVADLTAEVLSRLDAVSQGQTVESTANMPELSGGDEARVLADVGRCLELIEVEGSEEEFEAQVERLLETIDRVSAAP